MKRARGDMPQETYGESPDFQSGCSGFDSRLGYLTTHRVGAGRGSVSKTNPAESDSQSPCKCPGRLDGTLATN